MACPADGAISQIGDISADRVFQAKGRDYSVNALLGGDEQRARPFIGGKFATVYLSPRDYHRVHMPFTGRLREMIYVPGDLYSVNTATAGGSTTCSPAMNAWSACSIPRPAPWPWCWSAP